MTQAEVMRLFSVMVSPRDRALFGLIYHYGLRISEAVLLKPSHIDFDRRIIYIHRLKGGRGGEKPLLKNTAKVLNAYLAVRLPTGEALFTGRQGNLKRQRIWQLFKRYALEAGLEAVSVHGLRHSIATHMLEAGFEIEFVRDHLGHRNIQSTLIYAQITDKRLVAAFEKIETSPDIVKL